LKIKSAVRGQKAIFLILLLLVSLTTVLGQKNKSDSLKARIQSATIDTVKVNLLLELCGFYISTNPDSSLYFASQAKELGERAGFKKGTAYALKYMGNSSFYKSEFVNSLDYLQKSLDIFKSIKDEVGVSNMYNNIGVIYLTKGDDPRALEYFIQSLRVAEKINHKVRIATALVNIGAVYNNNKATRSNAQESYMRALPLGKEVGDNGVIGTASVNLGEIFLQKNKIDSALIYFNDALAAYQGDAHVAYVLTNIGKAYALKGDLNQAISYNKRAVATARNFGAKKDIAQSLIGLGDSYRKGGMFNAALENYETARSISKELGISYELQEALEGMSLSYAGLGDFMNAYSYQVEYNEVKNLTSAEDYGKQISTLRFQFDVEKKEAEIDILNKENDLKTAQIQQASLERNFLIAIAVFLLITVGGVVYSYIFAKKSNKMLATERNRSEAILLNILPKDTADELKENGFVKAQKFDQVTVLFTDFKEFTQEAEKVSPEDLVKSIDYYFKNFDEIVTRHNLEKIKTIGDAYMCAGGLPVANKTNHMDAVRAALEITEFVKKVNQEQPAGIIPFQIRVGVNTGPVVAGVVGIKKFQFDIWGSAVNIASRMESTSEPGKINISEYTYQLIKDDFECHFRGEIHVKHVGNMQMYFVEKEYTHEPMNYA
jgi:adenylate cyclase